MAEKQGSVRRGWDLHSSDDGPTLGYHKIHGLAAPLRMMLYYKGQSYTSVNYGADLKEAWLEGNKPKLAKLNACINLPYIIDGDMIVTQSNNCLLYLGQKLGIDDPGHFVTNHTVLDQVMDLRNDLMTIVYPKGVVQGATTAEEFPEAAKEHLAQKANAHFTKLEGFCAGPYMCGPKPQSGDFHVFEMLDQHEIMATSLGEASVLEQFPKLALLHATMKEDPLLARYFEADCYAKWAHNNPLATHFTAQGADLEYGPTTEEKVTF